MQFTTFSQQFATMAVTGLWQGAVIVLSLALCLRFAPRTSAEHRFALWTAAFITLASLPFFGLIASHSGAVLTGVPTASSIAISRPIFKIDERWTLAIAALWAAATILRTFALALHSFRLRTIWKNAIPVQLDSQLNLMLASASSRGPVEVCTTTTLQRPSVIGFFKPRILIPDWLFARLTPGELEQIVLHEAEHLRRWDDWTNLLQKICLALFPLNPALFWIERRLCREREMACDDGVIRITRAPRAYAACLASLAERGLQRRAEALSLGAWQRRPELVHRVHSILRRKHALGPFATRALLGTLGCGLLVGSVELARCPQLVAFVPVQPVAASQSNMQLLSAADRPLHVAAIASPSLSLRGRGTAARRAASLPLKLETASTATERNTQMQNAAFEWKTSASDASTHAPRAVFLKAEMPGTNPTPVVSHHKAAQPQQVIVLATWVQLQPANVSSGSIADYEIAAGQNAAADQDPNATNPPAGQVFVTRLILRMFPASSLSTQSASAPVRTGWFVIQL